MSCKDLLFKTNNLQMEYIGNSNTFNEIYLKINDPWDQSNINDKYYKDSRIKISS